MPLTRGAFGSAPLTVFIQERLSMDVRPNVLVMACPVSHIILDLGFTSQSIFQVALDELFLNSKHLTPHYLLQSTLGAGEFALILSILNLTYLFRDSKF